jgi:hypothetical protein
MLKKNIEKIIREQNKNQSTILVGQLYYPVDISLVNGNILLRAFRVISLEGDRIKGVTWKEEYSAPRENRELVFSYFHLEEIATLVCVDLEIRYEKEISRL